MGKRLRGTPAFELDARVRRLFDLSPDAIFVDSGGVVAYANDAAARLFGAPDAAALVGVANGTLRHPSIVDASQQRIDALIASPGTAMPFVDRVYRRLDGTPIDVEVAAFSFAESGGVHIVVTARDISSRKRAEAVLRESEARFHDFAAASGEWFWETDAEGRYTWFSEEVEKATGFPREWHYGKRRLDLARDAGVDLSAEPWRSHVAALERREPFRDFRYLRRAPDGLRWIRSSGVPFFGPDGTFRGYRGAGVDVTRQEDAGQQLRALLDGIPDRAWLKDAEGRYIAINRSEEQAHGMPAAQILGRRVGELRPADEAARVEDEDRRAMAATGPLRFERASHANGTWLEIIKAPIRTAQGGLIGMVAIARDITERKRAEKALRESEVRFRSLTHLSSDWYWEQDEQFRFTFLSGMLREHTGIEEKEHLGKTRWEMPALNLTEDDWRSHREQLERHEPFVDLVMRRPDRDGRPHWVSISGEPVFDDQGRFRGYRGIGRDVTDIHVARERIERLNSRLEDRVRERTAELEALVKELETFQYAIAHDLHTSLGVMSVNAGMLQNDLGDRLSEDHRRALRRLESSAQLTARLLDDLLAYARLGREEVHRGRVSMDGLAKDAWRHLERALGERRVVFELGALPEASGNARMLSQLWARLLSNAVKFTQTREPARVEVGFESASGAYFVRDNGVGFDMKHADRLFGVFERLHQEEQFEGTGVGLAIAARIVRRHGGRIWADARPGEGAAFWFTVPEPARAPAGT